MKTYTIQKLIELHKKQSCILELMNGQRGLILEKLGEMYSENHQRILHLLKLTHDQATADITGS